MTKRRKRKTSSSGTFTTLFEILFGGIAGAAIAAVWLIMKPVAVVDSLPRDAGEPPVRHAVKYQPGKLGLVRESQVRTKEQAVVQQSEAEVSLSEQEINRWFATRYGATAGTDILGLGVEMRPEPPMVRMADEEMQIGIVYSFSGYDIKRNMVLQAIGRFDRAASGTIEFVPTKTYLGSCPLPRGFVSEFVLDVFLSGFAISEELARAWTGIRDVALADGRLNLQFGTAVPAAAPAPVPAPVRTTETVPAIEVEAPVEKGKVGAEVAIAADTGAAAPPEMVEAIATVPVDRDMIEEQAEIEATTAQVPDSVESTGFPATPEAEGFETMTIEAGPAEEEPIGAAPASVPAASN